jgi:homoserine acetyltransferase
MVRGDSYADLLQCQSLTNCFKHKTDLETKLFTYKEPFALESGGVLPELELAYTTAGTPNAERDNVIWIVTR